GGARPRRGARRAVPAAGLPRAAGDPASEDHRSRHDRCRPFRGDPVTTSATTIYHNPACSTSRNVLAILRAAGEDPNVVDYLKTGWTEALLRGLFAAAGVSAQDALRVKATLATDPGLTAPGVGEA